MIISSQLLKINHQSHKVVVKEPNHQTTQVRQWRKTSEKKTEISKDNEMKASVILDSKQIFRGARSLTKNNPRTSLLQMVVDVVGVLLQNKTETLSHMPTSNDLKEMDMLLKPSISLFQVWTRLINSWIKEERRCRHQEVVVSEEVETQTCLVKTFKISQSLRSILIWTTIFLSQLTRMVSLWSLRDPSLLTDTTLLMRFKIQNHQHKNLVSSRKTLRRKAKFQSLEQKLQAGIAMNCGMSLEQHEKLLMKWD